MSQQIKNYRLFSAALSPTKCAREQSSTRQKPPTSVFPSRLLPYMGWGGCLPPSSEQKALMQGQLPPASRAPRPLPRLGPCPQRTLRWGDRLVLGTSCWLSYCFCLFEHNVVQNHRHFLEMILVLWFWFSSLVFLFQEYLRDTYGDIYG